MTAAEDLVARTTAAQNLPQHVEDPVVVGRVARLLISSDVAQHQAVGHA